MYFNPFYSKLQLCMQIANIHATEFANPFRPHASVICLAKEHLHINQWNTLEKWN